MKSIKNLANPLFAHIYPIKKNIVQMKMHSVKIGNSALFWRNEQEGKGGW
jgi:hypothetical protein